MIQKFQYLIQTPDGTSIPSFWAYRLYAALLEQLPVEFADAVHEQGFSAISQYIRFDHEKHQSIWVVSLLTDTAISYCAPILTNITHLSLHESTIIIKKIQQSDVLTADTIVTQAEQLSSSQAARIVFHNTASFKSNGIYQIFPTVSLILQNLLQRWNEFFPEMLLEDDDAIQMLTNNLRIRSYRLKSSTYRLKQSSIPGFCGEIVISSKLSPPMLELWKMLLIFSEYAGIGIKTALGMGGVSIFV